jgi:hypothetical protein
MILKYSASAQAVARQARGRHNVDGWTPHLVSSALPVSCVRPVECSLLVSNVQAIDVPLCHNGFSTAFQVRIGPALEDWPNRCA